MGTALHTKTPTDKVNGQEDKEQEKDQNDRSEGAPQSKSQSRETGPPEDKATGAAGAEKEKLGRMDMNRFFGFAQCSLKMEAQHFMDHEIKLTDPVAVELWPHFEKMATRNLG